MDEPDSDARSVGSATTVGTLDAETERKQARIAYIIMVVLGAGLLVPWNAIITAVDYFNTVFPDIKLLFYFPMAYIYPSVPLLFIMIKVRCGGGRPNLGAGSDDDGGARKPARLRAR